MSSLDLEMKTFQSIIDETSSNSGDPAFLSKQVLLAESFLSKYLQRSADPKDLELSFEYAKSALDRTHPRPVDLPSRQMLLAQICTERYKHSHDSTESDAAVVLGQQAVSSTFLGDPRLAYRLDCLGAIYRDRFDAFENAKDMDAGIRCSLGSVEGTPHGDPDLPTRQCNLAAWSGRRYGRHNEISDLKSLMQYAGRAIDALPLGSRELHTPLRMIGRAFAHRYKRSRDLNDIEISLKFNTAALASTFPDDRRLSHSLQSLSTAYTTRFRRLRNTSDLLDSLAYAQLAVEQTAATDPYLPNRLNTLADIYTNCHRHLHDFSSRDFASKWTRLSLWKVLTHPGSLENGPSVPRINMSGVKFLDAALKCRQSAVDNTPQGHPALPRRRADLVGTYMKYYEQSGDLSYLELAMKYSQDLLDSTPSDHPDLPEQQQRLADVYAERYTGLGDWRDLEMCTNLSRAAVEGTPPGHSRLAKRQANLGARYVYRYREVPNEADLDEGLRWLKMALDSTPVGDPNLAQRRFSVAYAYLQRFKTLGNFPDLDAAERYNQAAVNATPEGHHALPGFLETLSMIHAYRYAHTQEAMYLETWLKYAQSAVDKTPVANPDLAPRQGNLGLCYETRYKKAGEVEDLENALQACRSAVQVPSISPSTLWFEAVRWGKMAFRAKREEAVEAFSVAFTALPDVVWLGNAVATRHRVLQQDEVPLASSMGVAAALDYSTPQKAIEFFEAAVSITHKQTIQLKTGDALLWDVFPDDAKALRDISTQLQIAAKTEETEINLSIDPHVLVRKRKELIADIRTRPGFGKFLLPPSWDTIATVAREGPVVVLTATSARSDAIILLPNQESPEHVALRGVTLEKLYAMLTKLRKALAQCRITSRDAIERREQAIRRYGRKIDVESSSDTFRTVLDWLWIQVVSPVFECLRSNGIERGRIWWCASGPFTYLPLHASAPIQSDFIQSYTYTLESLIRARERNKAARPADDLNRTIIAVGVSNAARLPPLPKLPAVRREVEGVATLVNESGILNAKLFADTQATHSNVLHHLRHASWLHFACHGDQDPEKPLDSGLELYDRRLKLSEIMDANIFDTAEFVYLSACQTAMGDAKLSNEAMHLVGGFMAAGFRGAVGTLWSISDSYGPKVASSVYRKIFRENGGDGARPKLDLAAEGLQDAVNDMRRRGAEYHEWIPFIHVGI